MKMHWKTFSNFAGIPKLVAAHGELGSKLESNDRGDAGLVAVMLTEGIAGVLEHLNKGLGLTVDGALRSSSERMDYGGFFRPGINTTTSSARTESKRWRDRG